MQRVDDFWEGFYSSSHSEQLNYLVKALDDLTAEKEYDKIDLILSSADVERMSLTSQICLLTSTLWSSDITTFIFVEYGHGSRHIYPSRAILFQKIREKALQTKTEKEVQNLLRGLE